MKNQYSNVQIAIHSIMSSYNRQKINPEYSERHFQKFIRQIPQIMGNQGSKAINEEKARIMEVIDNAIEDDQK